MSRIKLVRTNHELHERISKIVKAIPEDIIIVADMGEGVILRANINTPASDSFAKLLPVFPRDIIL